MDIEKVIEDLNRRFAAPLPEYYERRIIIWKDEDQEFLDKLEDIQLNGAEVVALTGSNTFAIKKLLSHDNLTDNFLVYDPRSVTDEENWLLDLELCSEKFRADLLSIWMDELKLDQSYAMRKVVKHYRKFLGAKDRRAKLAAQRKTPETPAQLHMAVMAAICGLQDAQASDIIRCVLSTGLDQDQNRRYQELVSYHAEDAFWAVVQKVTGFCDTDRNLGQLASHILLTAATRTMHTEFLGGLEPLYSIPHQAYCYDLVSDWLNSDEIHQLYEVARNVEAEILLPQRFSHLEIADLMDTECFPCINEIILTKLMRDISDQIIDVDAITSVVEKRRTCAWYAQFSAFYDGLLQVANMQAFFKEHEDGFHKAIPKEIWDAYTSDYYRMDRYYRLFHLSFQKSLETSNLLLDDLFKHVADRVEGLYSYWYLGQLGSNWSNVCEGELKMFGKILEVPQQKDFYAAKIQGANSRTFVVISDAMRYEVAASLSEELRRETQSQVKLSNMQSIFPSITKFGMAALLPHKNLSLEVKNDVLNVLADGASTASTNRDQVLKAANSRSVALQYNKIIGMKRAERCALVKGMDVVYIYHDTIDEASHHSDTAVFPACEQAILELKNIVRIIVNDFGGANIFLTADHGFLYTYHPLQENSKVDKSSFAGQDVDLGRRHAIVEKSANPEYLMKVKLLDGSTDYDGYAPRESIRIKLNGGGMSFVHGGISLQEMVVPLIEYHYLRNDSLEYRKNKDKYDTKPVELSLLSASRKICNMIFNMKFYQKEPVSDNREAATYLAYFEDSYHKQVSDVQKIVADKTSENGTDRTFHCTFHLKSMQFRSTETYYLVIADEKSLQMPQREEFRIDIAFAVDDFGF